MIHLKRNDTGDTIRYIATQPNGDIVNLTGATARFLMGNKKSLITNAVANIVDPAQGIIEYTLTENDTILAGDFPAEFEVTFADGDVTTFPRKNYILVSIESNIDKNKTEEIVLRVSLVEQFKAETTAQVNNIQAQVNQLVVEGDSSVEAAQARVEADGTVNATLKARLDKKEAEFTSQLAQTTKKNKIVGTNLSEFNKPKNGIVSFITDDGQIEDYTVTMPIFRNAGVPCCTAIISDTIGDATKYRMTLEQILELQNVHGWEILSHTMNHVGLSNMTETEQEVELKGSIDQLNSLGLKCESIAYPFGFYNETTKRLTRKYYRSGRTVDLGLSGINYAPIDTYELKMIYMDSSASYGANEASGYPVNTFEFYKYYIDKAYETNGWLIITIHSGDINSAGLAPLLAQVVNYAKSKCPIMTFSQALDKMGNVIDIGDKSEMNPQLDHFTVGYNGEISSNNLDIVYSRGFNGNSPITDFKENKTTVNLVNNTDGANSGMPDGYGGTLFTYRMVDRFSPNQFYNYQIYHVLITGNVYKRTLNNDETWNKWEKLNNNIFINENSLNPDTSISGFKSGITINNISSAVAQTTNSPIALGGTLLTFKNGYNWQEYHVYNSNEIYKRVFNGDVPSAWRKITSDTRMPYDQSQQYDTNTTIQTFPLGVTYNTVSTARATEIGAPENNGGTLITKKVHATLWGYSFQEYHLYGVGTVYTRSFGSNGTPSAWVKMSN